MQNRSHPSVLKYQEYLEEIVLCQINPHDTTEQKNILIKNVEIIALPIIKNLSALNDPVAQYYLGVCYLYGLGIDEDKIRAVELFTNSAILGNAAAQNHLGYCLTEGVGIKKDEKLGVEWYEKSAKQQFSTAIGNLGYHYAHGIGVVKNEQNGIAYLKKAAKQGSPSALNNLGYCYNFGIGVPYDEKEAFQCFQKAALKKDRSGLANLGYCYYYGIGIQKNIEAALEWYHKAVKLNNLSAANNLGKLYSEKAEAKKAVEWYQKAAHQNYATAQLNLAICYEDGKGVDQNTATALVWYTKSANQGNQAAKDFITNDYKSNEVTIDNSNRYPELTFHQQCALQIPYVKGWVLWGQNLLCIAGVSSIVLNYLILTPYFETNHTQDYIGLRNHFLNEEFNQFKIELSNYANSNHGFFSGYQARANSFLEECKSLKMENNDHLNQWHESLKFVVEQFEDKSEKAKDIPLHKAPLTPNRDQYYTICNRYLLFTNDVRLVNAAVTHDAKNSKDYQRVNKSKFIT